MSPSPTHQASTPKPRERLDVETPEERDARLAQLLASRAQSSPRRDTQGISAAPVSPIANGPGGVSMPPFPSFPTSAGGRYELPKSDVLDRARAFLPQFKASNDAVLARAAADPRSVNMEETGDDARVIAMDVGLGVYDVKGDQTAGGGGGGGGGVSGAGAPGGGEKGQAARGTGTGTGPDLGPEVHLDEEAIRALLARQAMEDDEDDEDEDSDDMSESSLEPDLDSSSDSDEDEDDGNGADADPDVEAIADPQRPRAPGKETPPPTGA